MSSLNQVTVVGRLGNDPAIHTFDSGSKTAKLSIAVREKWKDKSTGERREKTEWIPVVLFGDGLVNVAEQYLTKGSLVLIIGKFSTRKWTDRDGADRYSTEVIVSGFGSKLVMLGGGNRDDSSAGNNGGGQSQQSNQSAGSNDLDDEVPF